MIYVRYWGGICYALRPRRSASGRHWLWLDGLQEQIVFKSYEASASVDKVRDQFYRRVGWHELIDPRNMWQYAFKSVISNLSLEIDILDRFCEMSLLWMSLNPIDEHWLGYLNGLCHQGKEPLPELMLIRIYVLAGATMSLKLDADY